MVIGDLVGFTTLAESLDPERVKGLVDLVFSRLANDLLVHGGTVDKVVGDGIIALFGAPVAHEDDPERAVRAALAMQRSVAAISGEMGADLSMRIGVMTGEVLVGGLAADDTYTAMGDTVNVASRLEEVAEPGTVLVGEATHRATATSVVYREHGQVQVRGRTSPVRTWVARHAIGPPGAPRGRQTLEPLGREVEGRLLDAVLDLAIARERAHLVEVTGDAGVGKRLVAEAFARRAERDRGALVLQARIPPYGEAGMWGPAADLLRDALGQDATALDRTVLGVLVHELLGDGPEAPSAEVVADALVQLLEQMGAGGEGGEAARRSAVSAIATVIEAQARTRPVIAILSNTQWGDSAMLDLMDLVIQRLRRSPVVAITTSRRRSSEADGGADLHAVLDCTTLRLAPLDQAAATTLAAQLLGPTADPAMVAAAVRRSGGNPRMLEEIAVLASAGDGTDIDDLPMTLRGLVAARLDALAPAARRLLEDAAMVGYTGSTDLLLDIVTDRGEQDPGGLFESLVDEGVLEQVGSSYRFTTDVLRETAYLQLPKLDRAMRHRDVAQRLAARPDGGSGTALRRRAIHLASGAELLRTIGSSDPDLDTEALDAIELAVSSTSARDPRLTLTLADRARAISTELPPGIAIHRARALLELEQLDAAQDAAAGLVADEGAAQHHPAALTVLGEVMQSRGDLAESEDILASAVEMARATDRDDLVAPALQALGLTLVFRGRHDRADAAVAEAATIHAGTGNAIGAATALENRAWIALSAGRIADARQLGEDAASRFRLLRDIDGLRSARGVVAWSMFAEGDLDQAEGELVSLDTDVDADAERRRPSTLASGMLRILRGAILLWRGAPDAAEPHAREAVSALHGIGHRWGEMLARLTLARSLAHLGQPAAALAEIDRASHLWTALGEAEPGPLLVLWAASIEVHLGDPGPAVAALVHATTAAGGAGAHGDASRLLALAALQEGRHADAVACARTALALARLPGASPSSLAASTAAAALAIACAHRAAPGAPSPHAEVLDLVAALDLAPSTYADAVEGHLALALTADDARGRRAALAEAEGCLASVTDRPLAGLVALVRAVLEDGGAGEDAVTSSLRDHGITGDGWLRALAILGADVPR